MQKNNSMESYMDKPIPIQNKLLPNEIASFTYQLPINTTEDEKNPDYSEVTVTFQSEQEIKVDIDKDIPEEQLKELNYLIAAYSYYDNMHNLEKLNLHEIIDKQLKLDIRHLKLETVNKVYDNNQFLQYVLPGNDYFRLISILYFIQK